MYKQLLKDCIEEFPDFFIIKIHEKLLTRVFEKIQDLENQKSSIEISLNNLLKESLIYWSKLDYNNQNTLTFNNCLKNLERCKIEIPNSFKYFKILEISEENQKNSYDQIKDSFTQFKTGFEQKIEKKKNIQQFKKVEYFPVKQNLHLHGSEKNLLNFKKIESPKIDSSDISLKKKNLLEKFNDSSKNLQDDNKIQKTLLKNLEVDKLILFKI